MWVVRDITIVTPGQPFSNDGGWAFTDSALQIIFGRANGLSQGAAEFYYEGRQVLVAGDVMNFRGSVAGYNFRVSGYQLSLP